MQCDRHLAGVKIRLDWLGHGRCRDCEADALLEVVRSSRFIRSISYNSRANAYFMRFSSDEVLIDLTYYVSEKNPTLPPTLPDRSTNNGLTKCLKKSSSPTQMPPQSLIRGRYLSITLY